MRWCFHILRPKKSMIAHHLYMKGMNWWGIFYRIEDCIMYFTTFSVYARRSEMVFVAFSIMFNHTHATTLNETKQRITLFQRQVGVSTAHTYNTEYKRKGQLWHHSYGSSLKIAKNEYWAMWLMCSTILLRGKWTDVPLKTGGHCLPTTKTTTPFLNQLSERNAVVIWGER